MTPVKTLDELTAADRRLRESAQAVGAALSSVAVYTSRRLRARCRPNRICTPGSRPSSAC